MHFRKGKWSQKELQKEEERQVVFDLTPLPHIKRETAPLSPHLPLQAANEKRKEEEEIKCSLLFLLLLLLTLPLFPRGPSAVNDSGEPPSPRPI